MTTLFHKITAIYPALTIADFEGPSSTILLQDDSNGLGPYIKTWAHPTYPQPTQAQLDAIP